MLKKILNTLYLIIFFISTFVVFNYYFSEKNVIHINKSRSIYPNELIINKIKSLPVLKNDTNNIISYSNNVDEFKKKKKKYRFFELLKKE